MECELKRGGVWGSRMPEGVELRVSQHPLTMRSVVSLVLALERLRAGTTLQDTQQHNLLGLWMDSLVEERIVFETEALPPVQYSCTGQAACSVTDSQKRSLVLVSDSMELYAVMLQGGDQGCKVHLNMSTYLDLQPRAEARTVALGIIGTDLYLSCHKDGDKPTLHLEEVADKSTLSGITSGSDMVRFLFYKRTDGVNQCTLTSVLFSGWYISTAAQSNNPVELCTSAAERHKTFDIHEESSAPANMECRCLAGLPGAPARCS